MDQATEPVAASPQVEQSAGADKESRLAQAAKLYQTAWILIYGKRKSVERAIKCVQRAITFDDTNYKFWQLLGEAYYQRGSLNPAINCFMKSLRLAVESTMQTEATEADGVYSRLRMSDIRLSVGHLEEAFDGYLEIIKQHPDSVPALIGLTKTKLQLARNSYSSNLIKSGQQHLMQALTFILRAIKLCPQLCLSWKLASDCCLIQFVHGRRDNYQSVIEERFPDDQSEYPIIQRETCLHLAQRFLCKALAIEPFQESSCLWHNLGISLYLKSKLTKQQAQQTDLLKRSLKCLLRALKYKRDNSNIKSSIGVVAFNLNLLNTAQSFMIKSIRNNLSTSEIQFSNLGYMYLQKGEFRLASVAFSRCQAEEPLYSRSWLGKALIEEQNNLENLPLLRHCHRLENNYQSLLLYAIKVVSLPQLDEFNKDLTSALDCMQRIINYDSSSVEAINTLGLLYERCNYRDQARECFERALLINSQDSRVILNKLRQLSCQSSSNQGGATINLGFIKTAEKLSNSNNREYILNFIYYLFNNGDFTNLNLKMTKVLDKLDSRDIQSKACAQILLGLAAKLDGGDFKSWFFKNIIDLDIDRSVCVEKLINIYCLMLMAGIKRDQELVDRISEELPRSIQAYMCALTRSAPFAESYYSYRAFWLRLLLFSSVFCHPRPRTILNKILALYPMISELWLFYGITFLLRKSEHPEAVMCIERAILLGRTCAETNFVCNILLSILVQNCAKRKTLLTLNSRKEYLSKAVYRYPQYEVLWRALNEEITDIKSVAPQTSSKLNSLNQQEFDLFRLAIKHSLMLIKK